MNVTLKNIDPVNAELTIAIGKDDYQPQVEKALNKLRKDLVIDGFRKGNAPKGRIQALYGKSVLVDEINQLVSEKLYAYIKDNQLNVLGEPLPGEKEQFPLDFDKQEDYEFTFDLALSPDMNVSLTKKDELPYYTIAVTDEMIDRQVNSFKANQGTYEQAGAAEERDMVKGVLKGSVENDSAVLMPMYIKNAEENAKFIGAKVGDVITFNPYKAYEGHEAELASFLKVAKEDVKKHTDDFTFTINEITRYKEAEVNQELFDKIYEPGTVTSEEAFRAKIKEMIEQQLLPESDYKFIIDVKQLLEEKAKDIQFPDAFLKRWLLASDEKRTPESIEEDYPKILADLKFHLIKEEIVKQKEIKVETDEIKQAAFNATRAQFAQYGMNNIPDNLLENYAQEMLKKEATVRNLIDRVIEDKIIAVLKEEITLQPKEVSMEEFQAFFQPETKE
ncbi:trigger factor [Bacteroidia bacterium]|nr:trigger factor [Bacteroidia bacterium]